MKMVDWIYDRFIVICKFSTKVFSEEPPCLTDGKYLSIDSILAQLTKFDTSSFIILLVILVQQPVVTVESYVSMLRQINRPSWEPNWVAEILHFVIIAYYIPVM